MGKTVPYIPEDEERMTTMSEERFMTLVAENEGFEFCQAYREDVDHILGGK